MRRHTVILPDEIEMLFAPRSIRKLDFIDRRVTRRLAHAYGQPLVAARSLDLVPVCPPAVAMDKLHMVERNVEIGGQEPVEKSRVRKKIRLVNYNRPAHSDTSSLTTRLTPSSVTCSMPARLIASSGRVRVRTDSSISAW